MIETKFGEIDNSFVDDYLDKLIGKFFKIIPIFENEKDTFELYLDSLTREIIGFSKNMKGLDILTLVNTLQGMDIESHKKVRSDTFKIIRHVERMKKEV